MLFRSKLAGDRAGDSGRGSTSENANLAHFDFCAPGGRRKRVKGDSHSHAVLLLRGFLSDQLGDVALFVNGLSMLIGLAFFKLHGFSTDDALWTPLGSGYMLASLNDLGH